jgi:O-antigen chain-terminating methyltransferase
LSTDLASASLATAREHADLGLPITRPARLRVLKRIVYRVARLFLHHQIAVNRSLIDELAALRADQAAATAALADQAAATAVQFELGWRQAFAEIGDHIARSTDEHTLLAQEHAELSSRIEPLTPMVPVVKALAEAIAREASAMHLARAEAAAVISRVRRTLPPSDVGRREDLPSAWDDLYLPFEEVFRGSSEVIRSRLSTYLADLATLDRGDRPVVDIGCGRGDWLSLLATEGIPAYGIDTNVRSVEQAQRLGLDARHGDVFTHLAELPVGSLAAITAFHLVEHLTIDQLVELLGDAFRALMPGGLLILETPNPENFVVGTKDFYMDPTHHNPLPSPLLAFLVGSQGFRDTVVRPLRRGTLEPAPPSALATLDPAVAAIVALVQEHLVAGEDYAVLAYR